jgi:hypothetical protein
LNIELGSFLKIFAASKRLFLNFKTEKMNNGCWLVQLLGFRGGWWMPRELGKEGVA